MNELNLKKNWKHILLNVSKYFGVIVVLGMIVFSVYCGIRFLQETNKEEDSFDYHVYQEMTQLKFYDVKYDLVIAVDNYIHSVAPTSNLNGLSVVDCCLEHDLDICFVLAQGEQESHFGTTGLARKTNSVWNVMAYDGKAYHQISKDGKYNHPDESIVPYMTLLKERYLHNGKTEYELMDSFVDKNKKRYAKSPTYEASIESKYEAIKTTTTIDSLSMELRHYAILLGY